MRVDIAGGDNQTATRGPDGMATFGPLRVSFSAQNIPPYGNVRSIIFTCSDCRFYAGDRAENQQIIVRSSPGYVSVDKVETSAVGALNVNVSGGDYSNRVTFHLNVIDPPPTRLRALAGDNQTRAAIAITNVPAARGRWVAAFMPLSVAVTDDAGRPLPGAQVAWTCAARPNSSCLGNATRVTTADANGIATLTAPVVSSGNASAIGGYTVTARANAATIAFQLTVTRVASGR